MRETLGAIEARLPRGYRARPFEDADREPIVAAANVERHLMERESADEWRRWESRAPDPTRAHVVVTGDGGVAASGQLGAGWMPRPDGSQQIHVSVVPEHRGRGIGSVILEALEAEATRRAAPRLLSGVSEAHPFAARFATKHGYREIGRRISSYRDLASFEPDAWRSAIVRVEKDGIRLRSIADVLAERDDAGRDRFWRELWEAEAPMWDDIPFSSPTPHWPYERFRTMLVDGGQLLADASVVAYEGDRIAGFTATGDRQGIDGWTWMTGVARDRRGRGLALALKVAALTRAKALGRRALGTTNDEPNKAMRGVNIKLGYQPVPAHIELEKAL